MLDWTIKRARFDVIEMGRRFFGGGAPSMPPPPKPPPPPKEDDSDLEALARKRKSLEATRQGRSALTISRDKGGIASTYNGSGLRTID